LLGKFWESVGGKFSDRLAAQSSPALVFWVSAVALWAMAGAGVSRLSEAGHWLDEQSVTVQIAALLGVLLVVAASTVVVDRLTTPMLRLMEGYWPRWGKPLRRFLVSRAQAKADADAKALQELWSRRLAGESLTGDDLDRLAVLEVRWHHTPSLLVRFMPTRVGNVLRAAETRPKDNYGLDAVIVWPRLWLVMPESTRQELGLARHSLDSSVAAVVWALAFCLFAPLSWWALIAGLAVATGALLWWVPARAVVFADLVDAAYDLHRGELYKQLRWPQPQTPWKEQQAGPALTNYLWRGSTAQNPRFTSEH
jgi:hypothetical protein